MKMALNTPNTDFGTILRKQVLKVAVRLYYLKINFKELYEIKVSSLLCATMHISFV